MAGAEVPHLAWPLAIDENGGLAVVEQDTLADVRQCVDVARNTPLGSRPLAPDAGLEDPTFTAGLDASATAAALMSDDNEPRADVQITANPTGPDGRQAIRIEVGLLGATDDEVTE